MKTDGELNEIVSRWIPRLIGFFLASYFLFNIYTLIEVPWVLDTVRARPYVFLVVTLNVLIVLNIPREIHKGREFPAFLSSCAAMALMMATFGLTYFPNMVFSTPDVANSLTIYNAASTQKTLGIMLIIALIGVPLVLAYTASIYWVFRGKTHLTKHSY
jgi:cytochrome d ubiquinol oxidase subunit II